MSRLSRNPIAVGLQEASSALAVGTIGAGSSKAIFQGLHPPSEEGIVRAVYEGASAMFIGRVLNRRRAIGFSLCLQELISRKVKENVTAPYGVLMQGGSAPVDLGTQQGNRRQFSKSCMNLLLYDAWSLDVSAKSGGVDGSIRLVEGLDAPVAAAVDEINRVKAAFDADEAALAPISWSDALVIAGLEKVKEEFRSVREARGISAAQGNAAPNPKLGRGDAQVADAPATVEALASLSTASQYKAEFKRLGLTTGELCLLAPCLTGDVHTANALLESDVECAKSLGRLEVAKQEKSRTSYE
eukprot:gene6906-8241_t